MDAQYLKQAQEITDDISLMLNTLIKIDLLENGKESPRIDSVSLTNGTVSEVLSSAQLDLVDTKMSVLALGDCTKVALSAKIRELNSLL